MSRESRFVVTRPIFFLGVASFFTDAASEIVYPLLPIFLTTVLGASTMFVGLVEGIAESTASLAKYAFGLLSDRLGKRSPFVLVGYGLANTVRPLIGLATGPWQVLGFRFTDRIGKGIRTAPREAWLAGLATPETRGRAFGFDRAMDHAGAVAGPLLATAFLFARPGDYRTLFLWSIVPGLIAVAAVVAAKRATPADAPVEPAPAPAAARATGDAPPLPPSLKKFFVILFLFTLAGSSDAFLLLKLKDAGVDPRWIPLLWSALHVGKSGLSLVGGRLADVAGRKAPIVAGWLWYAVIYLALAFVKTPVAAVAVFMAYGLYYGLTESAEKALVADLVPAAGRGRAFGLQHFVEGLGALPASLLFGFVWKLWGAPAAFVMAAALSGAAALLLMAWRAEAPSPRFT